MRKKTTTPSKFQRDHARRYFERLGKAALIAHYSWLKIQIPKWNHCSTSVRTLYIEIAKAVLRAQPGRALPGFIDNDTNTVWYPKEHC